MVTKNLPSAIPFTFSINGVATLTLSSRPHEIQFQRKKRLNRYRTRGGWVEEDWGDELVRVSGSGVTDGFLHPECGYTRYKARETPAYKEFLDLLALYRNNGFTYGPNGEVVEGISNSYQQPSENVVMTYRESVYRGYFDSLQWSEEAERPHLFDWSFEFTVVNTIYGY